MYITSNHYSSSSSMHTDIQNWIKLDSILSFNGRSCASFVDSLAQMSPRVNPTAAAPSLSAKEGGPCSVNVHNKRVEPTRAHMNFEIRENISRASSSSRNQTRVYRSIVPVPNLSSARWLLGTNVFTFRRPQGRPCALSSKLQQRLFRGRPSVLPSRQLSLT